MLKLAEKLNEHTVVISLLKFEIYFFFYKGPLMTSILTNDATKCQFIPLHRILMMLFL